METRHADACAAAARPGWDLARAIGQVGLVVGVVLVQHLGRRPRPRDTGADVGQVWHLPGVFTDLLGAFLWFP